MNQFDKLIDDLINDMLDDTNRTRDDSIAFAEKIFKETTKKIQSRCPHGDVTYVPEFENGSSGYCCRVCGKTWSCSQWDKEHNQQ